VNSSALALGPRPRGIAHRSAFDWLYALLVVAGAGYAFSRYAGAMDVYEKWILAGAVPVLVALGWFWGRLRTLAVGVAAAVLLAIMLYSQTSDGFGADLAAADRVFLLKYFLSSQSAILWMSVLFFMSTAFYWIGLLVSSRSGHHNTAQKLGSQLACSWRLSAPSCAGGRATRSRPTSATSRSATCTKCSCFSAG
jgi:hypothetical protein